jgi:arsenite methyltransferase
MALAERIALQLGRPEGLPGRVLGHVLNRTNRWINGRAVDRLRIGGGDSVLEVGFGGGGALSAVLGRTYGDVAGIEVSDAMLAHARRRFRRELRRERLLLASAPASSIPFADCRFDRVVSTNTIYFWPEPDKGLREIGRVLGPGGRVVIATGCPEDMRRRGYDRYGFRIFRDAELEQLLEDSGFSEVAVEREGHRLFGAAVFATGVRPPDAAVRSAPSATDPPTRSLRAHPPARPRSPGR